MNGGGDHERQPCGACKYLRQECGPSCIFAQFFPAEDPNSEARFQKANRTYSIEKMINLIFALNRDSGDISTINIKARHDLFCQQFNFFHRLRLLRFQDNIMAALRAAQASSSTACNNLLDLEKAIVEEEEEEVVFSRLMGPCVVCERRSMECGLGCVYAPYFPAAQISAERNLATAEKKFGRSELKDLIQSLTTMKVDDQFYLIRMLEFVTFMKQLYLENTDTIGAEAYESKTSSLGNGEINEASNYPI